ncbi:MAG: hypothetical protein ACI8WB_004619 [Phenylobacterium sp.]|jgi:hypothetical protein
MMEETDVDKTKVDDMMIHMIQPRLEEIEAKFSWGEGLQDEDTNTLLLKSQYNHINHLDLRMDQVTADVSSIKGEFKLLEQKLDVRMTTFEKNIEGKIFSLEGKISGIEIKMLEAINKNTRWSIGLIALIVTVLKLADTFVK